MSTTASSSSSAPPLAKYLASAEKKTRDKAIKSLGAFLSRPESDEPLSKIEMDKLWKGIFYCFWMSDKPLVQQALASELAEMILSFPRTDSALAFLDGFWSCTVREWNGIDRFRMDKYHLLVRRFLFASFLLMSNEDWDKNVCEQVNEILTKEGGPLCPTDPKAPQGLSFHIADIYLEELDKVAASSSSKDQDLSPIPLALLLEPFFNMSSLTPQSSTYKRIHSEIFEPLFSSLAPESEKGEDDSEDERPAKRARRSEEAPAHITQNACMEDSSKEKKMSQGELRRRLSKKLLSIASSEQTRDSNRRKLYAFWKEAGIDDDDDE